MESALHKKTLERAEIIVRDCEIKIHNGPAEEKEEVEEEEGEKGDASIGVAEPPPADTEQDTVDQLAQRVLARITAAAQSQSPVTVRPSRAAAAAAASSELPLQLTRNQQVRPLLQTSCSGGISLFIYIYIYIYIRVGRAVTTAFA